MKARGKASKASVPEDSHQLVPGHHKRLMSEYQPVGKQVASALEANKMADFLYALFIFLEDELDKILAGFDKSLLQ